MSEPQNSPQSAELPQSEHEAFEQRRKARNRATLWIAFLFVALLFAVTIVKLSENVSQGL
ncbi:MAG: hypothetical protein MRY63_01690 [Neomegalonema sp.]|nr:hypothetical protein [Neomegalonema sp.]